MRKLTLLPLLAAAFACNDNAFLQPNDALAPEIVASQQTPKMIPFKGGGTWQVVGVTLGCEGDPANVAAHGAGELNLTHLGKSEWSFVNCWTPASEFISQTSTVTAANGDELYWYGSVDMGTVSGFPTPTSFEQGPFWFTGGSGRFEGATGELHESGDLAEDFLSGTIVFDGELSSVGSSK